MGVVLHLVRHRVSALRDGAGRVAFGDARRLRHQDSALDLKK